MPDRRIDPDSRQRVASLERLYSRVAYGLTIGMAALTLGVVLALVFVWGVSKDNRSQGNRLADQGHRLAEVVRDAQANRVDVLRRSCETRNGQNGAIRAIFDRIVTDARRQHDAGNVSAKQLARTEAAAARAKASFPIVKDCRAYALAQIKPPSRRTQPAQPDGS